MGKKNTDLDMGVSMGWCSDYPDPYDWLNVLLYGGGIQAENNVNFSYLNNAKWNKKLDVSCQARWREAPQGVRPARHGHHESGAPMAVERTYNNRYFFSNRVNPKSLVFQGIYRTGASPPWH